MTPHQFAELARQNYNRIPVTREILADLETPLSCYLKLARGPYSYLFESVEGGEKWGRYSLIGLRSETVLTVRVKRGKSGLWRAEVYSQYPAKTYSGACTH